ncbi:hypothetical protein MANES_15G176756v8, partial [Manihot esculenta]
MEQLSTHNKMLENQIAQQINSSSKAQGKLPSQLKKSRECKAVHLRSEKLLGMRVRRKMRLKKEKTKIREKKYIEREKCERKDDSKEEKKDELSEKKERVSEKQEIEKEQEVEKEEKAKYMQFDKFLEILKKLYVNIPFIDALSQIPSYAKFLNDILFKKRRLEEYETMVLTEECNVLLQNKLPLKLNDSRRKALCDLGASISLLPVFIFEKLKINNLKPTTISLQLADKSIKYPIGILGNVPLKVNKFFIRVDFVVLKMEDVNIPIILRRPFLITTRAIIDVKNGRLKLKVGEEEVEFNFSEPKAPKTLATT